MKTGVVIARYNESVDWVNNITHRVYLYNKGTSCFESEIKLQNVGREAHTYLHHIVSNYNNLDDVTVFLQGDPSYHGFPDNFYSFDDFNATVFTKDFTPFLRKMENFCYLTCNLFGQPYLNVDLKQFTRDHGLNCLQEGLTTIEFVQGAQFAVSKRAIQTVPLKCYQQLYSTMSNPLNTDHAHTLERLWKYIFTANEN